MQNKNHLNVSEKICGHISKVDIIVVNDFEVKKMPNDPFVSENTSATI